MKLIKSIKVFGSIEHKPDFSSIGVMFGTGEAVSHAGVIIDFFDNTSEIIHAVGEGVVKADYNEFLKEHSFIHLIDVTDLLKVNTSSAYAWLEERLNRPYSRTVQFLGFVPYVGKALQKYLRDGDKTYKCSELTAEFMEVCCKIDLWGDYDFVSPKDFFKNLREFVGAEA